MDTRIKRRPPTKTITNNYLVGYLWISVRVLLSFLPQPSTKVGCRFLSHLFDNATGYVLKHRILRLLWQEVLQLHKRGGKAGMESWLISATNCPGNLHLESPKASKIPTSLRRHWATRRWEGVRSKPADEATDKQVVRHLEHAADRFLQGCSWKSSD